MVNVKEKKTNDMVVVNLTDNTKVEREKGALRMRRADMDVTAMLPGLTITAEGVGNATGPARTRPRSGSIPMRSPLK